MDAQEADLQWYPPPPLPSPPQPLALPLSGSPPSTYRSVLPQGRVKAHDLGPRLEATGEALQQNVVRLL